MLGSFSSYDCCRTPFPVPAATAAASPLIGVVDDVPVPAPCDDPESAVVAVAAEAPTRRSSCFFVRLRNNTIAIPSKVKANSTPRITITAIAHLGNPDPEGAEPFCSDPDGSPRAAAVDEFVDDADDARVLVVDSAEIVAEAADAEERLAKTLLGGDV